MEAQEIFRFLYITVNFVLKNTVVFSNVYKHIRYVNLNGINKIEKIPTKEKKFTIEK